MGKKNKQPNNEDQFTIAEYISTESGQYSLLPVDMPHLVKHMHGPVIDSVMSQGLAENLNVLLNDTSVTSEKPLPIQTRVMLSYEGLDYHIEGKQKFTTFDREVLDAVASLAGENEIITPAAIYRVMMGKRDSHYVTRAQEQKVINSMLKCGYSKLSIDLTDMTEKDSPIGKQLQKDGLSVTYSGNLISFEMVTLSSRYREVTCFRLLSEPALVRYAASIGRISEFPIDLLDTSVNKTETNIMIQSYLLRCIDEMYRGEASGNLISISKLYEAIEGQDANDQQKARFRTAASTILTDWKNKDYIKGFTQRKVGRTIKGFEINLNPQNIKNTHR